MTATTAPKAETNYEDFISKTELAKRLNKKKRTIENYMRRGYLPYYRIAGQVFFKWSDVEAWLGGSCRVDNAPR